MQGVLSMSEMSVCLSVRLSVKRVNHDKTKETCAHILIPYERTFIIVFRHGEWSLVGGRRPLVPEILDQTDPIRAKRVFSIDIRSYSASAVTPSEKKSN